MQADPSVSFPDNNIKFAAIFQWKYLELANENTDHFGWHNMKAYVKYHQQALEIAQKGHAAPSPEEKEILFREALYANGFADHFLTDAFSSGHVRMPRREALDWGLKNGYTSYQMGALTKVIHDNDPCVYRPARESACRGSMDPNFSHGVMKVRNARGDRWVTRSDGDLYREGTQDDAFIRLPFQAVAASVGELLETFKTGIIPAGVFAATEYVAFVDPEEIPLYLGFRKEFHTGEQGAGAGFTNEELTGLKQGVGILGSLVHAEQVRTYFKALGPIMSDFRSNVAKDIDADPILSSRLPVAYLDGYRNVQ